VAHDRAADLHREAADLHRRAAAAEAKTAAVNRDGLVTNDTWNREGAAVDDNLDLPLMNWHDDPHAPPRRDRPVANAEPERRVSEVLLDDGLPLPTMNGAPSFAYPSSAPSGPLPRSESYGYDVEHRRISSASEVIPDDRPVSPADDRHDMLNQGGMDPADVARANAARVGFTDYAGHPPAEADQDDLLDLPNMADHLISERKRGA
jgi:hypothetical protein